jgi:hypothetical protein
MSAVDAEPGSHPSSTPTATLAAAPPAPDVVHRARPHHRHRRRARWAAAFAGVAILVLAAGCGGSSSKTTASGSSSTTAKSGSGSSSFSAYAACLQKNGVKLPAGFGQRRPGSGTGAPSGTFPPGGFAGGGAGGAGGAANSFRNNPAFQKASQACASLRPTGGFGRGAGGTAFQAFVSCMSSHGVTLPSRGPRGSSSTSSSVPATTMNTSTPQYQAAYNVCKALLPTQGGSTTSTATAA